MKLTILILGLLVLSACGPKPHVATEPVVTETAYDLVCYNHGSIVIRAEVVRTVEANGVLVEVDTDGDAFYLTGQFDCVRIIHGSGK